VREADPHGGTRVILKRCPAQLCKHRIQPRFICCRDCWDKLPRGLRQAILNEIDECKVARIEHTQELLALRSQAIDFLSRGNRERFAKPQGTQLPLPT
jgi:hypothetical protein